MTAPRAPRSEDSKTRNALLDATLQLMVEEGYAAVSTRKVAAKAGANPALVYYYFRTMDELFLAVFRRGAEANLKRMRGALAAEHPLRAVWEVSSEPTHAALTMEFIALANHRETIRAELATYSTRFRQMQEEVLARALDTHGIDDDRFTPSALVVLIGGLSRSLAVDRMLGLTAGHDEVRSLIDECLRHFEVPREQKHSTRATLTGEEAPD